MREKESFRATTLKWFDRPRALEEDTAIFEAFGLSLYPFLLGAAGHHPTSGANDLVQMRHLVKEQSCR